GRGWACAGPDSRRPRGSGATAGPRSPAYGGRSSAVPLREEEGDGRADRRIDIRQHQRIRVVRGGDAAAGKGFLLLDHDLALLVPLPLHQRELEAEGVAVLVT